MPRLLAHIIIFSAGGFQSAPTPQLSFNLSPLYATMLSKLRPEQPPPIVARCTWVQPSPPNQTEFTNHPGLAVVFWDHSSHQFFSPHISPSTVLSTVISPPSIFFLAAGQKLAVLQ
jgi:hypothetical protein